MAKYSIDGSTLTDVADAVRELDGNPSTMTPGQMANRIRAYQPGADTSIIADEYDATATYTVGEYCTHDGGLYECTTAIPTAEAWTEAHWTAVTVGDELSDLKETLSQKYTKPSTGIPASDLASGVIPDASIKADKVQNAASGNFASLDANGNLTDSGHKHSDYLTEAPVTDVQVNMSSVLNNGVANIPMAEANAAAGVVRTYADYGISIYSDGRLVVNKATVEQIKGGINPYKPIVPSTQNESTFYGLAKAAGDTTQSASSNTVGTYTETAQSKIHEMLDAPVSVSGTTPTITGKAGIRYICGTVSTLTITPPASGIIDVVFTSGSTPTVLTTTGVTFPEWFDSTDLEANTTYEISIADGRAVVASWAV